MKKEINDACKHLVGLSLSIQNIAHKLDKDALDRIYEIQNEIDSLYDDYNVI